MERGSEVIFKMTNFSITEFNSVLKIVVSKIKSNSNTGTVLHSPIMRKDALLMTLTIFKHAGRLNFVGRMFRVKGPTFERIFMNVVHTFSSVQNGIICFTKCNFYCFLNTHARLTYLFYYTPVNFSISLTRAC